MRFTGSPTIVGTLCALLASQNLVHAKLGASLAHTQEEPTLQLRENFVSARALQELVSYGGKPDPERLPLGLCEGDCDEDEDCDMGLVCFQRDAGGIPVPGCSGTDDARNDYCINDPNRIAATTPKPTLTPVTQPVYVPVTQPVSIPAIGGFVPVTPRPTPPPTNPPVTTTNTKAYVATEKLAIVGNNGNPSYRFPLQMCQGDCDNDGECGPGLICYRRIGDEPVPGCLPGNSGLSVDYCTMDFPSDTVFSNSAITNPVPSPTNPPVTVREPVPPPTPSNTQLQQGTQILDLVGNNGFPVSKFPLGRCQGDCDTDAECGAGLMCFKDRTSTQIPTCVGQRFSADYCVPDGSSSGGMTPATPSTPRPTPSPLPAFNPTASIVLNPTTPAVATPRPTAQPTAQPTNRPIVQPTPPPFAPPTNPPAIPVEISLDFPLGLCQGDCDLDSNCAGTMICFQRDANQAVTGCLEAEDDGSRTDYCIPDPSITPNPTPVPTNPPTMRPTMQPTSRPTALPTNKPTPAPVTPNPTQPPQVAPVTQPPVPQVTVPQTPRPTRLPTTPPTPAIPTMAPTNPEPIQNVRLRLYWEDGYTWQESTKEKFWCMMSDYRGSPGTGRCWHGEKTQPCSRTQVYIAQCNNDKRQRFDIMFVENGEAMIKVSRDNRCFQRNGHKVELQQCDVTNDLQRWMSPRGAFFQRRFEIANPSLGDYCATQEHHPKPGEVVWLEPCILSRHPFHQSNFWMRW